MQIFTAVSASGHSRSSKFEMYDYFKLLLKDMAC